MKMLFFGPPGSGKGTMAARLSALLGIPHVSTGDLFRENINKQTPLGMKVKKTLDSGGLVSDEITIEILRTRLGLNDAIRGFILDGFPRTIHQADSLSKIDNIDHAIELRCTREVLIRRLTGRRSCPVCRRIYHVDSMPSLVENICDDDGAQLYTRKDDNLESVNRRLALYEKETRPLSDWYGAKGLLRFVNGSREADVVFEEIREIVDI